MSTTSKHPSTDTSLWTVRRRFGSAGGPDEIVLTKEGNERAFSVGAKVRRGPSALALEALWAQQGEGALSVRRPGSAKLELTALGRFDQVAWGHLRALGYVVSVPPEPGVREDGVSLTEAGKLAAWAGIQERASLLERCHKAAKGVAS